MSHDWVRPAETPSTNLNQRNRPNSAELGKNDSLSIEKAVVANAEFFKTVEECQNHHKMKNAAHNIRDPCKFHQARTPPFPSLPLIIHLNPSNGM